METKDSVCGELTPKAPVSGFLGFEGVKKVSPNHLMPLCHSCGNQNLTIKCFALMRSSNFNRALEAASIRVRIFCRMVRPWDHLSKVI